MIRALLHFLRLEYIRHFMTLFSSSVAGQAVALAVAPILSRLYSPADFGLAALYLSLFSIVSVLATAKYEQAIMLPKDKESAVHLFRLVILLCGLISITLVLPLLLFNTQLALLLGNAAIAPWLPVLPLSLMIHALLQASTFYANRTKAFKPMARSTLTQQLSASGAKVGAGYFALPCNGLIAGQIAGQLLGMLTILRHTIQETAWRRLRSRLSDIKRAAITYSQYPRFNMLLSLTNNLSGSLPIFLFTAGFSAEVAGLYAFGYTFVFRPLGLFSQSTQQVLSQKMIEAHHQGIAIYPRLRKMVTGLALLGLAPVIVLAIWAPAIFSFVFSETYGTAGRYLQIMSPWLFMVFLCSPLTFIHELFFRQKTAMMIDIVYLTLRFLALATGIWLQDVFIALALFSAIGTLVVGYKLWWYLSLARDRGHDEGPPASAKADTP